MTGPSCWNIMPLRYECLLQWQQNRYKAKMWLLYKIPAIWGFSRLFGRLTAVVAWHYPTTPTYYSSTTRDMSVGTLLGVNIDFNGYLQFLSVSFVCIMWVHYATDNLSGQQLGLLHRPVLIFQPSVNCRQVINKCELCLTQHYWLRELRGFCVSAYKSGFL
jgi:hypothetical protein